MVDEQIADAVALAIQLEENGQIKASILEYLALYYQPMTHIPCRKLTFLLLPQANWP